MTGRKSVAKCSQDRAQVGFFLSAELALPAERHGTVCSGAGRAEPGSSRAHCLQSPGSACRATQQAGRGCSIHAHPAWKHKQISATSRSKRLEELIFGFISFLLVTSGEAVTIPVQPVTRNECLTPAVCMLLCCFGGFCELMRLNNTGRQPQNWLFSLA